MSKSYRSWSPSQSYLLPPSPSDWLPEDHLVYFVLEVVEHLDLGAIKAEIARKDPRGTRPYHPLMMTALVLYGYSVGVVSSRKLERATHEDVAFRVLAAGEHPDHTRISEFRRRNLAVLESLFVQVLRLCQEAGLVQLGRVALDGTKMKANASKHKAMSYGRMKKTEEQLAEEVAALLQQAEDVDAAEDARYGRDRRGDELPKELAHRESRLKRIRAAKAKLEAEAAAAKARKCRAKFEAKQNNTPACDDGGSSNDDLRKKERETTSKAFEAAVLAGQAPPSLKPRCQDEMPAHQVPFDKAGLPTEKAQRNFTDAESRIMKAGGEYIQGYNAQAAVDSAHQIIVAQGLTNQPPDAEHLVPMMTQVRKNCGESPRACLADSGYWSEENTDWCASRGMAPYIATGRLRHGESPPPLRGRLRKGCTAKEKMSRKLRTQHGREVYRQRKFIVEPVFGQIKAARGLRTFLLRGIDKVRGEWALITTGHNILKLYRAQLA